MVAGGQQSSLKHSASLPIIVAANPALRHDPAQALDAASRAQFGAGVGYIGQGGTIPLMNMLSRGFPRAQMMVCGVLGPRSNAHGPNEFLHVPFARRLTAAVAQVMAALPSQP